MKKLNLRKAATVFLAMAGAALLSGCGAAPSAPIGGIGGGIIGPGGCAPVTAGTQIPFTMNGVVQMAPDRSVAGVIPNLQTAPFGQVILGGGAAAPNPNSIYGFRVQTAGIGGSSILINPTSPSSATGVLTLSPGDAQLISQYGNCISGLGLMMRYTTQRVVNPSNPQLGPMFQLYLDSVVYLFMNNNSTAFPLEF